MATKIIGLIGKPLAHSVSPAFQQAALDHLGIDARYELWEMERQALPELARRLRQADCLGANVTIPYKEEVISLLDELEPLAARIGAVNTIVNRDGCLWGHNTDVGGFARALREDGAFDPQGADVLLLGAGGGGRAAAAALIEGKAATISVVDIVAERAEKLVRDLTGQGPTILRAMPPGGQSLAAAASRCQLLVNCTPIGMRHSQEQQMPMPPELIHPGMLVFDIIFNPPETRLLAEGRRRGGRTLGGLPMLVYQGAASFKLWTGREAPLTVMAAAARRALGLSSDEG